MINIQSFGSDVKKKILTNTTNFDIDDDVKDLFAVDKENKNRFYFENLCDDQFFDTVGVKLEFVEFYKKIIKSGVGAIVLGGVYLGLNSNKCNNLSRISIEDNILSAYKEIVLLAHAAKCKVYLQVKSIYGRFNGANKKSNILKRGSNFTLDPENKSRATLRLSDGKCDEMINDLSQISLLSSIVGFDGVVIDASLSNIIGELSSPEYNKRVFGYYSATNDFLKKCLKKINVKNATIILKYNICSFISNKDKNIDLCRINNNHFEQILTDLLEYIKLGVDGFEFYFGTLDNSFLKDFNPYQDELIFEEFYKNFRKYLTDNNIKNKFGEEIKIYCHDNINNFSKIKKLIKENIINYIDVTKNIYSDNEFIRKIINKKSISNCIKCSYCNQKTHFNNEIQCLVNPSLLNFTDNIQDKNNRIIAIIGSGIAGLICALTLIQRGYIVYIYEQKNQLNPMGKIMSVYESDKLLLNYYKHIESMIEEALKRKRIQIFLNQKFNANEINFNYYSIIVATGFKARLLSIVGAVQSHVHNIYDVLKNKNLLENKKNIVIYVKSDLSLKLAKYIVENYKVKLTLIIKDINFLLSNKNANLFYLFYNLYNSNANILFLSKIIKINEDNIEVNYNKDLDKKSINSFLKIINKDKIKNERIQHNIDCDLLIYDPDTIPNADLYYQLAINKYPNDIYLVGNALTNSNLAEVIRNAYFVAKNI